jgi:hypothetical protein
MATLTPAATPAAAAADKKRKKKRGATGAEPLARQAVYLSKMHKAHHGSKRMTISAQALGELERIFDFTTDALLRNCKGSMNYLKTKQLSLRVARGGAGLTLTGRLGEAAIARGNAAVAAFEGKAEPAA